MSALVLVLAFAAYAVNACFGAAVLTGRVNSRGFRWLHHVLYVITVVLALAAVLSLLWSSNKAGWYLLPVLGVLAALPYVGSARRHRRRHMVAALIPLPFYALALALAFSH